MVHEKQGRGTRGRPKRKTDRPKRIPNLDSPEKKNGAIAALLAQDASLADIEAATGVSITTIRRGGFITPVKRQRQEDEVSTPTPEVKGRRKLVKKYHKKNRRATSQDIVWKLAQENEIFVSKRTETKWHSEATT